MQALALEEGAYLERASVQRINQCAIHGLDSTKCRAQYKWVTAG